uniref:GPI transamidase subunit PIG-U n=1 Tax=Kalanchoe fedtschenkoi TaxID=63787 RepID=A0A7N0UBG5_KALFE
METKASSDGKRRFRKWAAASIMVRMVLIYYSKSLNLAARPELSTPLTSLRRLAEGYWLKQESISPYAGSMYHGSPLLLSIFGPLTVESVKGFPGYLLCSLLFVAADFVAAMLLRETGRHIQSSNNQSLKLLGLDKMLQSSEYFHSGDIAALIYLWNPMTILTCVGSSTTPIENLIVILTLYGASTKRAPLAAFGWVMATHLSLYPAVLIIPVILLTGYGLDGPPRKLFCQKKSDVDGDTISNEKDVATQSENSAAFSWKAIMHFFLWVCVWSFYILILCGFYVRKHGGLLNMFKRTYGFILTVEDLSPNIGVQWLEIQLYIWACWVCLSMNLLI